MSNALYPGVLESHVFQETERHMMNYSSKLIRHYIILKKNIKTIMRFIVTRFARPIFILFYQK